MTPGRKLLILAIGLIAFILPLGVGIFSGYLGALDNPQRNWYYEYNLVEPEFQELEVQDSFLDNYRSNYATAESEEFQLAEPEQTYTRTIRSIDGGPLTFTGDNNPFSPAEVSEPIDTFTFLDLGTLVYDNLAWFVTDWRPLSFLDPAGSAAAVTQYAVIDDVNCGDDFWATAGCWASISGGSDDTGPAVAGDAAIFDGSSGAGTMTLSANAAATSIDTTLFGGTLAISTFELDISGSITHAGGIITIGVSAALGLDVAGNLTMSGTSSITSVGAGDADIDGNVVLAAGNFIDFDSGWWTVGGTWTNATTSASWDAGTGMIIFDDATAGTMTFAGANLAEAEFNDMRFNSTAGTAQIFTMATRGLRWSGTLNIEDVTSSTALATADLALGNAADTPALSIGGWGGGGILTANASTVIISSVTMDIRGGVGLITVTTGAWTVSGNWDSDGSGATYTQGTGIVTFDAVATITMRAGDLIFDDLTISGGTVTMASAVTVTNTLTLTDELATADFALIATALIVGTAGILTANASTVVVTTVTMTGGVSGVITITTGAWTVSGSWNTSGVGSAFTEGTSSVTFDATATITTTGGSNDFYDLDITAGTLTQANALEIQNDLTLAGGTYAKGTQTLVIFGDLLMTGGDLTSTSGTVTVGQTGVGLVNISNAASAINFGSETWNVYGTWSSVSTDTGVWDAGTATVWFRSTAGGAMTFSPAGLTATEPEFYNLQFNSTAAGPITFTMGTNALRWSNNLEIMDDVSTTTLATGDLALSTGALIVGVSGATGGILTANASTATLASVTMNEAGGTITVTTGVWTVSGNWDTSGATSTYTQGTGIVTFDAVATITMLATDLVFDDLTITGGTVTMASAVTVSNALTLTDEFATADFALILGSLVVGTAGILTANASTVNVNTVDMTGGVSGVITVTTGDWTVSGSWDTSGAGSTYTEGTGAVDIDAAGSIDMLAGQNFDELAITGGPVAMASAVVVTTSLTLTAELQTADFALTAAGLVVGTAGVLTANAAVVDLATVTMTGGVSGVITVTTGLWTVSGNWNTSGAGSTWTEGTGGVTIDAAATITMLAGDITFDDLTISGGPVVMAQAVSVTDALALTAELQTGDFTLTAAGLTVGTAGILTANASTVDLASVTMTGGVSGVITVTSGAWTVSGNWNTSGAGSTYTQGTSAVTFDAAGTITMLAGDIDFAVLLVTGGPVVMASAVTVTGALTLTAELQTGDFALTAAGLVVGTAGVLTANAAVVDLASVTMTGGVSGVITVTTGVWTVSGNWNTSGVGSAYTQGTGSVTIDAAATVTMLGTDIVFDDLLITGGPVLMASAVTVSNDLTLTAEFQTADLALILGGLIVNTAGVLTANASVVTMATVTMTGGVSGVITVTTGAWTVSGAWDTSGAGSTYTQGTGIVTFDAIATITMLGTDIVFDDLTIAGAGAVTMASAVTVTNTLTLTDELATADFALIATALVVNNLGQLTANASVVDLATVTMTGGASGAIVVTTGVWTVSGNWNTSGAGSTYTQGTGSVDIDAAATITMLAGDITFANLTISGGPVVMANAVTVTAALALTDELQTGDFALTAAGLTVGTAGVLTANASVVDLASVTMTGGVSGVITVTTGLWTVSGNWNTSGAGSTYTQGTGAVDIDAAATITMLAGDITFDDLTISGGVVVMANAVTVTNTLTLTDELQTGDFALTAVGLVVNNAGILTANAAVVDLATVTMTGGASGTITVTTGAWTVSGNWDTSGAGSVFTEGTGLVTFDAVATVTLLAADNTFANLTISPGAAVVVTLGSAVQVTTALIMDAGNLNTDAANDFNITGATLSMDNVAILITNGADIDFSGTLTIVDVASYITSDADGTWIVTGNWTSASTDVGWAFAAPITFDGAGASQSVGGAGTNNVFADVVLEGTAKAFTANITTDTLTSIDAAKTLTITDTITWTVGAAENISGAGGNVLSIVSSTPGTQWTWTSAGAVTITFASITDAAADAVAAATAADFDATAANNTDGENNTYVEFAGSPVTEYIAVRWYEDADSYYWAGAVDGAVALTQFDVATDLGYQGTTVDVFGPAGISTWTACNSVVGAAVTFTLGGLANDAAYWLRQDGVNEMVAATNGAGVGSWTTTGSWDVACATNAMALGPIGGGGGAPTDPPEVEDPTIFEDAATWVESVMPIIAIMAFALSAALGLAFFLHRKLTTALWALVAMMGGIGMWLASMGAESFMAGFQTVLVIATAGFWIGFGLIRSPRIAIYAAIVTAITVFVFLNPF